MCVTLEGSQLETLKNIDAWAKAQALQNSREWFGKAFTQIEIDVMYNSPIKIDEDNRYAPHVKAKINLTGMDKYLTQVTYVRSATEAETGSGWNFVGQRLGEEKLRNTPARLIIEARRIWVVGRKFGLTYTITDLAVQHRQPARVRVDFDEDNTFETLAASE